MKNETYSKYNKMYVVSDLVYCTVDEDKKDKGSTNELV